MPPTTPAPTAATATPDDHRIFEKFVLVLLFLITVTQFSTFGYQSVTYILGLVFNVPVISTPLDVIIGIMAMTASALVFAGAAMWWKMMPKAASYLQIGSLLFIGKNIFDLINETILFSMANEVVSMEQIQELAGILGGQFFQLAFWAVVYFYFRYVTKKQQP